MGRTFSSTVTAAPVVISPGDSHDEIYPHYTRWSYENAWDPDDDAFFKDAVYEAIVSPTPLEPMTPIDSSDDSSSASSGRGTPAELPPVPSQVLPSDHEVNRWLDGTSPSDAAAALDGLPPLPTPRRHSTSEPRHRTTQSLGETTAAFERFQARRFSRARVVQYLPAFIPDSDSETEAPASAHPGVSVHTSEITPIQLPLRGAISTLYPPTFPSRPVTPPPPAPLQSAPIPVMTPNGDAVQLSPPPSVSPRIYNWSINTHPVPESPTVPSRIRVPPARWPVY